MRLPRALVVVACCFLALSSSSARADVSAKLKAGLTASSPKVRIVAVSEVAKTKDPAARALIEPLLSDPDAAVRASVVDNLGRLGDPASVAALSKVKDDPDDTVKQVLARVLPALEALRVSIYVGKGEDKSGANIAGLADQLAQKTKAAIDKKMGALAFIHDDASKQSFGASPLIVRSIGQHQDGGNTFLDVKCDLLIVEMPKNALRGTLSTTASVGVAGPIPPKMQNELAHDAVDACAPDLADDFVAYVKEHARR